MRSKATAENRRDAVVRRSLQNRFRSTEVEDLYRELLKQTLTRMMFIDEEVWDIGQSYCGWESADGVRSWLLRQVRTYLGRRGLRLVRTGGDAELRRTGRDWPSTAETMVGVNRLDNVQECIEQLLAEHIPGDLIETGVWRGGCSIFMRAVLAARKDPTRAVWVADSFQGLSRPDHEAYPDELETDLSVFDFLAVSLEQVQDNFRRYGLLDERVRFLPGWFKDTLPTAPIEQLALIRLDGDYYESTITALTHLYPKLSREGFVIVDDYSIPACAKAVADFRAEMGEASEIHPIDFDAVYWRKSCDAPEPGASGRTS
jgi:O-methyltransferase